MTGDTQSLPIGERISLPGHFATPVVLEEVRPLAGGYECLVRLPDGGLEEVVISQDEAEALVPAGSVGGGAQCPSDPEKLRLLVESRRIRLAYAHDPQFAVSLSGIRTLPHQIEAVYQHMLPQPRLRFLLADDPGAGKTIMAGLLIKELKLREAVERVLILCPAPLTIQWQDEMQTWFGETFDPVFSAVDQQQLTNPWRRAQVVSSIDYAKQPDVRERIWREPWDLVIIDEAHKCSAHTESDGKGREPRCRATRRYELASRLTERADHVLLLTATPHHGDDDQFAHFLRLIDPDVFPEPHRLGAKATEIRKRVLSGDAGRQWVLRRLKEDLRDTEGRRLFPPRYAHTVQFSLNADEFALYKAVTAYINEFMPHQTGKRKSSAALARTVLQRRLASSTRAIHESLRRRLEKQDDLLKKLEPLTPAERARYLANLHGRPEDAELDEDDLDDEARDELVDEYTAAKEMDQLRAEVATLQDLVERARRVREAGNESKLLELRKCLAGAEFAELKDGRGKLLVFTEHRDTLNHVREHLDQWGYSTCEIHGGMNPHERKRAQDRFHTEAQVCVATEAAGEGINLQFCHLMVNYDMPWNPTRLEQRLGRIHRIGQKNPCHAFNFVATDSVDGEPVIEGRILERLLDKMKRMSDALEGRVFDVIGEVLALNDVNLPEMLREAAYYPQRLDEFMEVIEAVDPERLRKYEEATGIVLARAHVDMADFERRNIDHEERRLMPAYVEAQFLAASREVGLRVEARADGLYRVEHVPADMRSERLAAVRRLDKPEQSYRKITFRKEHLEQDAHLDAVLVGPGHVLYAVVDEKLTEKLAALVGASACYVDALASAPYLVHFFEISIRGANTRGEDLLLHGELVAVREEGEHFELISADVLHDLDGHPAPPAEFVQADPRRATDFVKTNCQLERRAACQKERQALASVCREYLISSFEARIRHAQERYMRLQGEAGSKPEYGLAADEAMKHLQDLERAREQRLAGLGHLEIARTGPIRHVATAVVLTAGEDAAAQLAALGEEVDPNLRRRVELAAEDIVIRSLLDEGFPEDGIQRVGHQKIGFDIRAQRLLDPATGAREVRRIEVKGRAPGCPVPLTENEWRKAITYGNDYWLYVVWDPLGPSPVMDVIRNPAERLDYAKTPIVGIRGFRFTAGVIREHGGGGW